MKTIFLVLFFLFLSVSLIRADSRNNAKEAITKLKQSESALNNYDELKSIESTFFTAEEFRRHNSFEMSERYYLLTIQKVHILLTATPAHSPSTTLSVPLPSAYQTLAPENHESPVSGKPVESLESIPLSIMKPAETTSSTLRHEMDPESDYLLDDIESDKLVGQKSIYSVANKDTLRLIAAKLGVSRQHLVKMNHLDLKAALKVGQKLTYNNRKIVPQRLTDGIIINIPDRTLYFFRNGKLASSLPVALGSAKKGAKYDWTTPTGKFTITAKVKDPTWYVPQSIRAKMEEEGKDVITSVPPGPGNPLGKYAIKTSMPGILIHSTTRPGSIYSFASHGCIRVYPEHMEKFFKELRINTRGEIIYHPVKLAITEDGRIFLEVHHDAYGKSAGLHAEARQMIEKRNISKRVDWDKVKTVIAREAGFAEDITL